MIYIFEVCHEGDNTQIQESVDMVGIWTNQNDMRLNSEKCKEMVIDFSRNYSLNSERVEHAKCWVLRYQITLPGANMSITLSAKQGSVYICCTS